MAALETKIPDAELLREYLEEAAREAIWQYEGDARATGGVGVGKWTDRLGPLRVEILRRMGAHGG